MTQIASNSVIAVCGDLMLTRECIADLQAAGFSRDHISLITPNSVDELENLGFISYGSRPGETGGRGTIAGGVLGAFAGTALLTIPGAATSLVLGPLALGVVGAALGAVLGAASGGTVSKPRLKQYEHDLSQGQVLLVCQGEPSELTSAFEALQDSACRDVQLYLASPNATHAP